MSLFSFDANDPSFNLVKSDSGNIQNRAGLFGAYAAGFLNDLFGIGSLLWPVVFAALGAAYVFPRYNMHWWRWCGLFLLTICMLVAASATDFSIGDLAGGGMTGNALNFNSKRYLSPTGSFLLWFFVFLIGLQLVCNFSWISLCNRFGNWIKTTCQKHAHKQSDHVSQGAPTKSGHFDFLKNTPLADVLPKLRALFQKTANQIKMPDILLPGSKNENKAVKTETKEPTFTQNASAPTPAYDDPFPEAEQIGQPQVELVTEGPEAGPQMELPRAAEPVRPVSSVQEQPEPEPMRPAPVPGPPIARQQPQSMKLFQENSQEPAPLPPVDLLVPAPPDIATPHELLREKGQRLMSCLKDFDVDGELVRITPGPVVTMYEIRPARGIKVSRFTNLSDDLSLALKATTVRIQAPVPGSDTVGVEIPNDKRQTVNFRELVETDAFQKGPGPLTMILGKDIAGRPYMADLTKMPHLLIAGATGAGKSVCLNAILVSLLYRAQPSDMRLLLVDPKRMEMAAYADLPHLVHPVVTEMDDAKNALDWAVHEMQNRNRIIPLLGVRNVAAYNQKLAALGDNLPENLAHLKPLPYIVIVIDELADLMMTAAREVETSIVRLAQLARAAGIHMILATQRPSVDVVTGLIKANFLCRISFQVTSKHDSRTILDQMGAEHLLGRGDMLFKPSGGRLIRLHGPFLSDEEVQKVADHWRGCLSPNYEIDFSQWTPPGAQTSSGGGDATSDPLYEEARNFVLSEGRASISRLQRQFNIGFNRAARIIEQFEREGMLGPADGSKPRNVIR